MHQKFEWVSVKIDPNDQTFVGYLIKHRTWKVKDAEILLDVGAKYIMLGGRATFFDIDADWFIRQEKQIQKCKAIQKILIRR